MVWVKDTDAIGRGRGGRGRGRGGDKYKGRQRNETRRSSSSQPCYTGLVPCMYCFVPTCMYIPTYVATVANSYVLCIAPHNPFLAPPPLSSSSPPLLSPTIDAGQSPVSEWPLQPRLREKRLSGC